MHYLLAFDPSMAHTGYAILSLDGMTIAHYCSGELNLNCKRDKRALNALLDECATLEGFLGVTYEDNPFNAAHHRSAAEGGVIRRGQAAAVGVLKGFAMAHELVVLPGVNGKTAKKLFAGHGNADKDRMMYAAKVLLGITATEHEADACGVAYTGLKQWCSKQKMLTQKKRSS